MSSRPAPRRSSLTGSSPITPPPPAAAEAPAPPLEDAAPTLPPAAAQSAPSPVAPAPPRKTASPAIKQEGKKYPHKVSFYQDPDDTARVRGAILHTQVSEGTRSLSQFISQAVMDKVEELEAKYNNGEPFGPIGARELPQGRPMGE